MAFTFKQLSAQGLFEGYASLFGIVDQTHDRVAPGAFRRTLLRRPPAGIKMLYQHLAHEPIGVWERIIEDARGLYVRGRLVLDSARGRDVLALMRAGAIDGLSIGFRTVRGQTDQQTGVRTILEIDLWEVSVVTFPMLPGARVLRVKGAQGAPALHTANSDQ
ncbi:MAG: HK97 family phage prohead protease [Alphaproteobacteria bacterium]|nr:HK97 family phage prohead protease [Alphaproteobacteria bacterium]